MALTGTATGTKSIDQERRVIDMSSVITDLEPSANPLTLLTKKIHTATANSVKFEWMEENIAGRWTQNVGAKISSDTSIVVTTGTGVYFAVGDLVKVIATGEVMRVTGISTDTLTVARGYGETTAGAVGDAGKLLYLGNANMQGADTPAEKKIGITPYFNYTQIFRTPFSVTNTLQATKLYGKDELARLRAKKAIEHAKSIEYSLLFGERKEDLTGEQPQYTTRGVLKWLSTSTNNTSVAKSSVAETDFIGFLEKLFTYGSDERIVFASPSLLSKINSWAQSKLEIEMGEHTYGLNITRYVSPHGNVNFIKHPLLVNGYDGYGIALDPSDLSYRPLAGRDTKLKTNVQGNGEDGQRDEYLTEVGLELRGVQKHGLFILT